ncbi:MAG: hypothetical protein AAFQ22_13165 [Pseudomonadota bacterium]
MIGVTKAQREFLLAVDELTRASGMAPSYGDLAHTLGYGSVNSIFRLVRAMVDSDLVYHDPDRHRSLKLTGKGHRYINQVTQDRDLEVTPEGALAAEGFVTIGDAATSAFRLLEKSHGGR